MEFFERTSINLASGQNELIEEYVKNHPSLFDNKSHFVRCAVTRHVAYLHKQGRFAHQKEVLQNE